MRDIVMRMACAPQRANDAVGNMTTGSTNLQYLSHHQSRPGLASPWLAHATMCNSINERGVPPSVCLFVSCSSPSQSSHAADMISDHDVLYHRRKSGEDRTSDGRSWV